jgi:signal transduction histidine kinase
MKIGQKLMILFSGLIIATVGTTSVLAFQSVEASVIDSELQDMSNLVKFKEKEIQTLHDRASEDLVFAVQNPRFVEYFELPETKAGNVYDENGVIQFTPTQQKILNELDDWIFNFQNKFTVDETCLIDTAGQEHTRLVFSEIAPDEDLSSEESAAPFFEPSFKTNKGSVHHQYPYVSPDSGRWVFAYTTPIVLDDGTKPAFYHFEMPITIFQELVNVDFGRMYVIDPYGFLIADSDDSSLANARYNVNPQTITSFVASEYFPSIQTVFASSEYNEIIQEMPKNSEGSATYSKDGELQYVNYRQLPTFGWILVYEKPYSLMLVGDTNLENLRTTIGFVASAITAGGLLAVFVVSYRIAQPIKKLAKECKDEDPANLQKISVTTTDEVNDVSTAVNEIIDKVNELEKQKEEFTSMITHELKTPLTPIIGWCQTLQNPKILGTLTEPQLKAINSIHTNAKRLQLMIGDVLDAQKLDMDRMRFDYRDINVNEFMEHLHTNLQNTMEPKQIEFINNTKGELKMKSDKNRLEQVFSNLILNAIDFVSDEGGRVEIGAEDKGDSVFFYVKDNGIGIKKEIQEDLFKKFYQVDASYARKHGGTGLGLSVSKGIVEALGGKLGVESEEGKGSNFHFTIPKESKLKEKPD